MQNKSSKVAKCRFTKEWSNPSGQIVYYHELVLENGDVGNVGTMEKYSDKIKEGAFVSYTIDENNKIRLVADSTFTKPVYKAPAKSSGGGQKHEAFIGYAWSYAKDMVIAGKGMQDVDELRAVARFIYDEIGRQLHGE